MIIELRCSENIDLFKKNVDTKYSNLYMVLNLLRIPMYGLILKND